MNIQILYYLFIQVIFISPEYNSIRTECDRERGQYGFEDFGVRLSSSGDTRVGSYSFLLELLLSFFRYKFSSFWDFNAVFDFVLLFAWIIIILSDMRSAPEIVNACRGIILSELHFKTPQRHPTRLINCIILLQGGIHFGDGKFSTNRQLIHIL